MSPIYRVNPILSVCLQGRTNFESSRQGRTSRVLATHLVHQKRPELQLKMTKMVELEYVVELVEVTDQCLLMQQCQPRNSTSFRTDVNQDSINIDCSAESEVN